MNNFLNIKIMINKVIYNWDNKKINRKYKKSIDFIEKYLYLKR